MHEPGPHAATRLGRDVVLKVYAAPSPGGLDAAAQLERDLRAASALSHPNVCTVHDISWVDDRLVVVMEVCRGRRLRHVLRAGPLPRPRAIDVAMQVADALADDPVVQAFLASVADGIPMPNIPEMGSVWGPVGDNLLLLRNGELSAEEAVTAAATGVREAIAG